MPSGSRPDGTAHVEEHRAADIEELEGKPVGEHALLCREQPATRARLVAQRIAAQPIVPAEQDLLVDVEIAAGGGRQTHEEQPPRRLTEVVARFGVSNPLARLPPSSARWHRRSSSATGAR